MAYSLQASMASCSVPSSSSFSSSRSIRQGSMKSVRCSMSSSKIPMPPLNPNDPFLKKLSLAAANSPESFLGRNYGPDMPPFLDIFESPQLMAQPAQVEGSSSYGEHRPKRPPPDLPSLLLHGRIVYLGMPLVPAVTELIIAELMYLQYVDGKEPIYLYINSTGTTRDDGESVGMEYEGFAIYDAMSMLSNEIITVAVGAAIGHACLLLAAGTKGKRFMMPHAKAMIQQPRAPSSGGERRKEMQLCACSSSSSSTSSSSCSSSPSSASNPTFNLFSPSHGNPIFSRPCRRPLKLFRIRSPPSLLTLPPCSSNDLLPVLQEPESDEIVSKREDLEQLLVVRRPLKDPLDKRDTEEEQDDDEEQTSLDEDRNQKATPIDASLENFAKKLPIFEPLRGGQGNEQTNAKEKPLSVNLDLALYRAKILTRNFQFEEAEKLLQQCLEYWPEDGRPYVALGKVMRKQSKMTEARAVYEKGCQATQGENAFIWQCWADLENRLGNVRRARELFDAATVANKKHIAAWHGWAVLELKQGNIKKARNLLGKGLKYCGGNEYVYQTLALLESKAGRYEQARQLFRQATKCNPKSCASWLAWAQLEMQLENNPAARKLCEKAVQASPKNRFAWHVWGLFEANFDNVDKARKLLKIGHLVNPKDPVILQSLALLEYQHSTANLARVLFRRASELDPTHQPVWFAWGWMEWKEGNIGTAREYYQKALSIDSTSESAARCLQAWGVLEQRAGNLAAARRLFRSSLNVNSQSYVTWMTWATMEEDQGNSVRAEEIRDLYFQQRTEVVDDASWVTGFLDIFDPAIDSLKKVLNMDDNSKGGDSREKPSIASLPSFGGTGFDLDAFIKEKLSLDPSNIDDQLEASLTSIARTKGSKKPWRLNQRAP